MEVVAAETVVVVRMIVVVQEVTVDVKRPDAAITMASQVTTTGAAAAQVNVRDSWIISRKATVIVATH